MSGGFDVGSIVGHLVLDKNQWTQAVNSVRQDQAALKKSFSSLSEDLRDVGRGLAVAGAAITGTFTMLIKGAVDAGDEINDLSKKTGISTELLSGYKLAADKSGTSLQGFAIGMKGLANQMQAAHDQGGAAKKTLDSLGVSYQDNTGKLRPLDQVLLDVADRFTKMPDGATKSALAVDVFGKAGADLIPLLNLGRRGLEENYAAAEKLGLVYSKDAAEGADEFNDSLAELKGSVQGLGNQITQALMPTLKPIVSDLKDVIVSVREWAKNNPELAASLAKTALGAGTLAGGIGAVCIVLPSFLSGWSKLWPLIQAAGPYIVAAGAAWAGWKFGEQLGEITGLNQAIQDEISSGKGLVAMYLKWTGQLREVNVEFGEKHAAAAATREAAIKRASAISGQAVTTIQDAVGILQEQWRKTGTTGDTALDAWLKKFPDLRKDIANTGIGIGDLSSTLSGFGVKTRTELTAELKKAEDALKALRGTTEATPGAIKTLEDTISGLREQLYGAKGATDEDKEALQGLIDKADPFSAKLREISADMSLANLGLKTGKITAQDYAIVMDYLNDEMREATKLPKQSAAAMDKFVGELIKDGPKITTFGQKVTTLEEVWGDLWPTVKETSTVWDTAIGNMMSDMVRFGDGQGSVLSAIGESWSQMAQTAISASEMQTLQLLSDDEKLMEAKKQQTLASYIAAIFEWAPWPLDLVLAAAAFGVINSLWAKVMKFEEGGVFNQATLAVLGEGKDTEYALPEKKLVNIVRDAMTGGGTGTSGMSLAPAAAGAGEGGGGTFHAAVNMYPRGVSRRDLEEAGSTMTKVLKRQVRRGARLTR